MAGDDDHGPWLTVAMVMFLTWTILFYSVRIWAKLRVKTAGLDDWAVTFALLVSAAHQGLMYIAVDRGFGKRSDSLSAEDLVEIEKLNYAAHFLYIIPMGFARAASAFFVQQVSQHGLHARPARITALVSAGWTMASLFVVAIRPPYSSPWLSTDGRDTMFTRWIGIEVSGLAVEVALWVLAIHLVWSLQMRRSRRIFIVAAFGVRLLLVPLIAMRLYLLAPSRNHDPNYTCILAAILTSAALQFSIVATSITALKPFLTVFSQPTFAYGSGGGGGGGGTTVTGHSTDPGDPYFKLEMFRKVSRQVPVSDDSANWRPDQASAQRSITAQPGRVITRRRSEAFSGAGSGTGSTTGSSRPHHGSTARPPRTANTSTGSDDGASAKTDVSDRMIIQKTTEVMVRYEDKPNAR